MLACSLASVATIYDDIVALVTGEPPATATEVRLPPDTHAGRVHWLAQTVSPLVQALVNVGTRIQALFGSENHGPFADHWHPLHSSCSRAEPNTHTICAMARVQRIEGPRESSPARQARVDAEKTAVREAWQAAKERAGTKAA